MRNFHPAVGIHLRERGAQHAHLLVTIAGRNREADAVETIGFWTGADHEDFVVEGVPHTFYGAGSIMSVDPLTNEAGVRVRTTRILFSTVLPEVQLALRGYHIRKQPCSLYVAYFDPDTHALIGVPQRAFKGYISGLEMTRPELGGSAEATLHLLSSARRLTQTLTLKKSNVALRARHPGDGFRRHSDISGAVEAVWGEVRASAPAPARATQPANRRTGADR